MLGMIGCAMSERSSVNHHCTENGSRGEGGRSCVVRALSSKANMFSMELQTMLDGQQPRVQIFRNKEPPETPRTRGSQAQVDSAGMTA